MKFMRMV